MRALELRVPPPIVALIVAAMMWEISRVTPSIPLSRVICVSSAAAMAAVGVAIAISGVLAFRSARTTVNPLKPETTSAIVTSGIYRFTRNPMYLGMALTLVAWATLLRSAWALLGPMAFVIYINRFQIIPEEQALSRIFGASYAAYRAKVRRWL